MKKKTAHQTYLEQIDIINRKFQELKRLRTQISNVKTLYIRHDELMEELLPLFISVRPNRIIIKRTVMIGSKKYRYNPYFYDVKKLRIVAKIWKSAAFESGSIE